jgi:uncharacterized protein (DUF1015 family)
MAEVQPFRGWRYNMARVGELSNVVAPPYDVIDERLEQQLLNRHPANIVRIELGKESATGVMSDERYSRAARTLQEWKVGGTLMEDSTPSIYVVHQIFDVEGTTFARRGFLARLRLEPFGTGQVFPHEETMAGPKADRLKLYHATGMNPSPIFGMYPDPDNEVQELLEDALRGKTPLEAVDHLGVVSRMWPVSAQQLIGRIRSLMAPRPVFIADGHHRYETALRYREERDAAGAIRDGDAAPNFCLMMFAGMSDPGLLILPTHRLIRGLPGVDTHTLRRILSKEFEIQEAGEGVQAGRTAWELIEADGSQELLGFCTVADGKWLLARLRSDEPMRQLVPQHSADWCGLGVSILHELVLHDLLREQFAGKLPETRYVHLVREVSESVERRDCDLACLVPSARMSHVERIASTGERMPAKSTYFYPKLLTGLVLNPIA